MDEQVGRRRYAHQEVTSHHQFLLLMPAIFVAAEYQDHYGRGIHIDAPGHADILRFAADMEDVKGKQWVKEGKGEQIQIVAQQKIADFDICFNHCLSLCLKGPANFKVVFLSVGLAGA
jgi:hypothetical protein